MIGRENVLKVIQEIGNSQDKLLEILIKVQNGSEKNNVSEEQLVEISKELAIPLSKVYGVASFYSMISVQERGKNVIQICNSGPCYVKGSRNIVEIFESELGIKMGEVTKDGLFSLEFTSCIGACDIAPAVKINDELYGNLDKDKIAQIVSKLREEGK